MYRGRAPERSPAIERRVESRSCAVLQRDGDTVVLTDRDAAVYLYIHHVKIHSAVRNGRSFIITMFDPDRRSESLVMDFVNSESSQFANGLRTVNKILHSFGGNGGQRREDV